MEDLVQAVRHHANLNYNMHGWDYVVETMDDDEIRAVIAGSTSKLQAITKMAELCRLLDAQRNDSIYPDKA